MTGAIDAARVLGRAQLIQRVIFDMVEVSFVRRLYRNFETQKESGHFADLFFGHELINAFAE
jgi:hypothetical protein